MSSASAMYRLCTLLGPWLVFSKEGVELLVVKVVLVCTDGTGVTFAWLLLDCFHENFPTLISVVNIFTMLYVLLVLYWNMNVTLGLRQNTEPRSADPLKIIGNTKLCTNQVHKYHVTWGAKNGGRGCNGLIFFRYKYRFRSRINEHKIS